MNKLSNIFSSFFGFNTAIDFPLYLQEKPEDCGPTCLKMIFSYYHKHVDKKKIQTLSKMGSRGASLLHLSETAENFGFRTLGVRISYSKFLTIPLPAIIHWKTNCFSVVYKITYRNVWIADPGMGKFKVKKTVFCKDWLNENQEGIALLFELKKDR